MKSLQKCFSGLQKLQLPFFPGDWATTIRNFHQQTHSVYSICILRVLHCPGDRSFWAMWGCCWNKHVLINVPSSKYSELKLSKTGNTAAFISYFLLTEHRTLGVIYMNMNESSICQCCESFDSNVLTQHGADTLIKPSNASADFKSWKKWLKARRGQRDWQTICSCPALSDLQLSGRRAVDKLSMMRRAYRPWWLLPLTTTARQR